MKTNNYSLPTGFYDLSGDIVELYNLMTSSFLAYAKQHGYSQIIPSLIEFEDNINSFNMGHNNCQLEQENHLKTIDPISGKAVIVRSDITVQVAHIIKKRIDFNQIKPNRICYVGDSFQLKNHSALKQITQIGLELVGSTSKYANIEIINIALGFLEKKLLFKDLVINFSIPSLTNLIINLVLAEKSEYQELIIDIMKSKNISKLQNLDSKYKELIERLILPTDNIVKQINLIRDYDLPQEALKLMSGLLDMIAIIASQHENLDIVSDLIAFNHDVYHRDMSFTIYDKKHNMTLCKGGRYLIDSEESTGFTIYSSDILNILDANITGNIENKRILVPANLSLNTIEKLHNDGYVTIAHLDISKNLLEYANYYNCSFIYQDNQIQHCNLKT